MLPQKSICHSKTKCRLPEARVAGPGQLLARLVALLGGTVLLAGAEPEEVTEKPARIETPPYTVTPTEIQLPGVVVDRRTREVRLKAEVCLKSGILEYVVCRPNTFEHEAIFTTEARPELVHAALLLSGLKATPQRPGLEELWREKAMKRPESRLKIEVAWEKEGETKRVRLVSLLRNRARAAGAKESQEDEGAVEEAWVFAGSSIEVHEASGQRRYAANQSGILVGIWPNPTTVIQYGLPSGNPYEGEEQGMELREKRVPEPGTPVTLIFSRAELPSPSAREGAGTAEPEE